ncbi:MAG: carboxypeptidase-like regulatory domain-containing protein, partial [Acidobacteria bacterium]|nr:carboxypeptidase-like regulatory domain-containing protein [Acidobacteriota bacterium]
MSLLVLLLGLNFHFNLITQQTFVIIGNIRDTSGQPVGNVRVSVSDENMLPIRTIMADSAGNFRIAGLRVGNYMIRVETFGTSYEEQTHRIELQTIRRGRSTEEPYPIDFVL